MAVGNSAQKTIAAVSVIVVGWPVASARPIAAARAPPAAAAAAAAAEARCGAHGGVTQREAPVPRGTHRRARVAIAAAEL